MQAVAIGGSFRDPCGRVLTRDGIVYRIVLPPGRKDYERLMQSGLYEALIGDGLLVPHDDLGRSPEHPDAVTVLRPEQIATITYPYEWSVSQLRQAALATLRIQSRALEFGCWLKDASAFNMQFHRGRAVLIDTLSLEPVSGAQWPAYRQFCQHFYAPLLLATRVDPALTRLHQLYVDGPPLDLASRLLPPATWLSSGALLHVHLHAAGTRRLSSKPPTTPLDDRSDSSAVRKLHSLVESLQRAVDAVRWTPRSHWTSYASERESYSDEGFHCKEQTVTRWLERLKPATVWDLGANTGHFSRMAAKLGARTLALDADPACVETLVQALAREPAGDILPIVYDLANPTPALGWANQERMTLKERGPADLVLALALIHHLAIGNNVPLQKIAEHLSEFGRHLILEFVPKADAMVRRMLETRRDVFHEYTIEAFERALTNRFETIERVPIGGSLRTLYLLAAR